MSLTSLTFLGVYFPLLLIAYYNPIVKNNAFRKFILLGASLGLYAVSDPINVFLLIGVIILNYCFVFLSDKINTKVFRMIAIVIDVLILLLFKYIHILIPDQSANSLIFPIGLSYLIFKAISYVVDSSKEKDGNLIDVAIYISNFLTIVSGPLSKYKDELSAIRTKETTLAIPTLYRGLERLMIGLSKKVIIADNLGILVNQCFSSHEISSVMAWAGAIAYTLQLFFDFSGYTDMAIGVGYIVGFHLPENFNYPYMATSISDFWKRWHISLTKWFTEYIYIPLGGSRVRSVSRHIFNLFVVWFVTGIWHGSTLNFILWAMIYFVLQLLEKYTSWILILSKIHLNRVYTLLVIIIEWVIFRSNSISHAITYLKTMFFLNHTIIYAASDFSTILKYIIPFLLGLLFSTDIGKKLKAYSESHTLLSGCYHFGLLILFVGCIIISLSQGYSAPLYAGF